jgi:WD40 repeat protein
MLVLGCPLGSDDKTAADSDREEPGLNIAHHDSAGSVAAKAPVTPSPAPARDVLGDVIPQNAIARLGTRRLRQKNEITALAYTDSHIASSDFKGAIELWDAQTGAHHASLSGPTQGALNLNAHWVHSLAAHGSTLAAAYESGHVRAWDGDKTMFDIGPDSVKGGLDIVHDVTWAPDGAWLATAHGGAWRANGHHRIEAKGGCRVCAWRLDGKLWRAFQTDGPWAYAVAIGKGWLASAHENGGIRVFDTTSGAELHHFKTGAARVPALAASADGEILISGDVNGRIYRWNPKSGARTRLFATERSIKRIAISADGAQVAWVDEDSNWGIVPLESGTPRNGEPTRDHFRAVAFSPDGQTLVLGGVERRLHRWDVASGEWLAHPRVLGPLKQVAFGPNGQSVVIDTGHGILRFSGVDWQTVETVFSFPKNTYDSATSPDGTRIAVAHDYDRLSLFDAVSGRRVRAFRRSGERASMVRFSADGRRLVTAGAEGVRVWEVASGKQLAQHNCSMAGPVDIALSPNGERVAASCPEDAVHVWQVGGDKIGSRPVIRWSRIAWSPNGESVAYVEAGGNVTVWIPETDTNLYTSDALTKTPVTALAFRPDGHALALGTEAGQIRIDEWSHPPHKLSVEGHDERITDLAWSSDGKHLASVSTDGTGLIWTAPAPLSAGDR